MEGYIEGRLRSILRESAGIYSGKVEEYIDGKWRLILREGGGVY